MKGNYKEILLDDGWEKFGDEETYRKSKLWLRVDLESTPGVDFVFSVCHNKYFDRWANSRLIRFESSIDELCEDPALLVRKLINASYLFRKLKRNLFSKFMAIYL